jgi:hypothetical protein
MKSLNKLHILKEILNENITEIEKTIERENKKINKDLCPICLDVFSVNNIMTTECGHTFHSNCFIRYMITRMHNVFYTNERVNVEDDINKVLCPVCRFDTKEKLLLNEEEVCFCGAIHDHDEEFHREEVDFQQIPPLSANSRIPNQEISQVVEERRSVNNRRRTDDDLMREVAMNLGTDIIALMGRIINRRN